MRILGGGEVKELSHDDEIPHAWGEEEWWQESVVLAWWDFKNNVGGYHRIGHEPNHRDGPKMGVWSNVFSPEWTYKHADYLPMKQTDRLPNGFGGGDTCRFDYRDGRAHWTIEDQDVKAALVVKNSHPPFDAFPKHNSLGKENASNHLECAGTITGVLEIKGKTYDIDGLAFRDHGRGNRIWLSCVCHRWIAATFGPEMSALIMSFIGPDNVMQKFACIIRNDTLAFTNDVDIVVYLETDGISHRGGHATVKLKDGEVLRFQCEPLTKGVISYHHGLAITDILCRITCGDRVGFCDFEMTNNYQRGTFRPYFVENAFEKNGFHRLTR